MITFSRKLVEYVARDTLDTLRMQVVKGLLDEFPEERQFVKGYLKVYH